MKPDKRIFAKLVLPGLILLMTLPAWSQADNTSSQPVPAMAGMDNSPDNFDDHMQIPPTVSGQAYSTEFTSEERSNYLRGGVAFTTAYTDNAIGAVTGSPVSDVSYSVSPMVAFDKTTPRLRWTVDYAPGFTFYQRLSSRNQTDQNASIAFQYRLSPHVTFTAQDGFQKSSNAFNQQDLTSTGPVSGTPQNPNFSVIAPVADLLRNSGNLGLNYQFSLNSMIGVSGTFSNLHYPNSAQVPGLSDAASQGGAIFYSLRISKVHYFGATYQYQRLVSYPSGAQNETQTHALLFFYSLFPTSHFSISFFGGPQHSDTVEGALPPLQPRAIDTRVWTPAAGASLGWTSRLSSFAVSYSHVISGGGGLTGAVQLDGASASFRQRITKTLTASVAGGYTQNDVLGSSLTGTSSGHTISGTASVQQQFGEHLNLQLGYERLHQSYGNVDVLSSTPDTNREFVSLSYQFSRPLGR